MAISEVLQAAEGARKESAMATEEANREAASTEKAKRKGPLVIMAAATAWETRWKARQVAILGKGRSD